MNIKNMMYQSVDQLTPKEAASELEYLSKEITRHDILYYERSEPIIEDSAYDLLRQRIIAIEKRFPELAGPHSVSNKIGTQASIGFTKVRHKVPMLSLGNAFSDSEIHEFIKRTRRYLKLDGDAEITITAEPKIDGLSASLHYANGNYVLGATRGDGIDGEDVTENLRTITDVPKHLLGDNIPNRLEIRGEVYMETNDFSSLNKERENNNLKRFVNPRNAASGALRQINSKITAERRLHFFAYAWGDTNQPFTGLYSDSLTQFEKWGFKVNPLTQHCKSVENAIKHYHNISNQRSKLPYEIDGVVFKINRIDWQERLGASGREPRWAIAYKFAAHQAETILKKISIQVGRTGIITPVAELQPVAIGGVTITRASLHNKDEIIRKDLREGDHINVKRAGDVIPQVLGVIIEKRKATSKLYQFPDHCPVCNAKIYREGNEVALRCSGGLACPAQTVERLHHFVSRDAFDIEGLGTKQIHYFWENKLIQTPSDIFTLEDRIKSGAFKLASQEGWGEKSTQNLFFAISSRRSISLERFIFALGIPNIGQNSAKLLARFYGNFVSLRETLEMAIDRTSNAYTELTNIDGIGNTSVNSLINFILEQHNIQVLNNLEKLIEIQPYVSSKHTSPISGKTIVFTGTLQISRAEAKFQAEALNANVSSAISKKTDILVAGESAGSKLKKAIELKVRVLNEEEWLDLIN